MDDETALREALRAYVTAGEPPAPSLAGTSLAAGRRSRRIHTTAWFGSGTAVAVAVVLAVVATAGFVRRSTESAPVASASLSAAACPSPDVDSPQSRITCYLTSAIPALLPDVTFSRLYGPRGSVPLAAYSSTDNPGAFDANAIVRDAFGTGSLVFSVSRSNGPGDAPTEEHCESKGNCALRRGPHGETIAVYASVGGSGQDRGHIGVTLYVYSGHTVVIAGTSNADERSFVEGVSVRSRPEPPLTTEQLVEVATAPELVLFP